MSYYDPVENGQLDSEQVETPKSFAAYEQRYANYRQSFNGAMYDGKKWIFGNPVILLELHDWENSPHPVCKEAAVVAAYYDLRDRGGFSHTELTEMLFMGSGVDDLIDKAKNREVKST